MTDRGRRDIFGDEDVKKTSETNGTREKVKLELEQLAKKGHITPADIIALYQKYPDKDSIVEEILRIRARQIRKIKEKARKLAERISNKYSLGSVPLHEILDKMLRYKVKHKWSDAEYDEFRKELSGILTGTKALEVDYNKNLVSYRSRISRALGSPYIVYEALQYEHGLRIKDTEHSTLNDILKMYQNSFSLHRSVFMHSLMYEDCSLVAMTGEYKRDRHIASNHIHPLIACMFLPKFDIFEVQMLYSNFGSIIKTRHEKRPIVTEPDWLLFDAITTDPNDIVCEVSSPILDIKNRYNVQIKLWETVLKLRQGNYYEASPISDFMTALNACRNNLYDNADLIYSQDEGSMMRKILSVFSLRPTIITTRPIYGVTTITSASCPIPLVTSGVKTGVSFGYPYINQPVYTITSIPMITLQIPPYTDGVNITPIDLRDATTQTIWINENKTIMPKEQSIIYSKEVLIFYVNRRIQRIQIRTFTNPLMFSQLPLTMSSFERLNTYPVNVPERITLGRSEDVYQLRSVVAVTETEIVQGEKSTHIITGCTGLIMSHRDLDRSIFEPSYYLYDPFGASLPVEHPEHPGGQGFFLNKPISKIPPYFITQSPNNDTNNLSFFDRASRSGTIFIYSKPSGYSPSDYIGI
jgi:hypothetical protein